MEKEQTKIKRDYRQWYEDNYPQLTGCGIWLRGNELNTLAQEEYETRDFRVLLVRLSTYSDVAESFTHQILYQIASKIPGVFPDIAYLPPQNDIKIFEKGGIPWLLGTKTKSGPEGFSLIAFSNSIVQEILNIPRFLKTGKIPLNRNERLQRPDIPLVILGGSNSIYTTSIWGNDSWVDGVFTGTDSSYIKGIFETCADGYKNNITKTEILRKLETIPGFYSTAKGCLLTNTPGKTLNKLPAVSPNIEILEKGIISYNESEMGSGYIQISTGCKACCSFCAENWLRKPYRDLDASWLYEKALAMKAEMGLEKIDLSSFNFNMYSQFYKLLRDFSRIFKNVSLKSQRFDMLARNSETIEYQSAAGKTIYSCGLEGISQRLRKYLNKNLNDDTFYKSLDLIFKVQARELKIFILSTGLEDESDFKEFYELLHRIRQSQKKNKARTRVVFSITPLVKFPWTPLEFDKAYPPEAHERIIAEICRISKLHQFEARQAMDTKEYLVSQILVRASDSRIKKALLLALENTDFVYHIKISSEFYASFRSHLLNLGVETEKLLAGFSLKESFEKPWAAIDTGIRRKSLWKIFRKNVCFEEIGAAFNNLKIDKPVFTARDYREELARNKANETTQDLYVTVNEPGRGLPRKYFGIILARALMKTDASLIPYYRSYSASFWEKDNSSPVWIVGDDIISLSWDKKALPALDKILADRHTCNLVNKHLGKWGLLRTGQQEDRQSLELQLASPYKFDGTNYFKKRGLKYTLYKNNPGNYQLVFTKESLKKKIISKCGYTLKGGIPAGSSQPVYVNITPAPKFNIDEFLHEAFVLPHKNDWVRIIATARMETASQTG